MKYHGLVAVVLRGLNDSSDTVAASAIRYGALSSSKTIQLAHCSIS